MRCSTPARSNAARLPRSRTRRACKLTDADGTLREELPPITTFLNRMLALTIDMQNSLFEVFEQLLTARIEGAIAAGIYDRGLETLAADSLIVNERRTVYTHPATGAETRIFTIARRDRNRPLTLEDALARAECQRRPAARQQPLPQGRGGSPGAEPDAG